jgi:hypothetical protein
VFFSHLDVVYAMVVLVEASGCGAEFGGVKGILLCGLLELLGNLGA